MASTPEIEYILKKLEELSEEVELLKAKQDVTKDSVIPIEAGETTFVTLVKQVKQAIDALNIGGKQAYVAHSLLVKDQMERAQIIWLEELLVENSNSMAKFCLALSNEHRINILKILSEGVKSITEITEELGIGGGPLYHHLKELLNINFIQQPERSYYNITEEGMDALMTVGAFTRRNMPNK